jgi:hypothetical protein
LLKESLNFLLMLLSILHNNFNYLILIALFCAERANDTRFSHTRSEPRSGARQLDSMLGGGLGCAA